MELLRQDKKEIFRAAKEAQAIADLILDRHPRLRLEQGVAVPWTGSPEPDGLVPDTADPPAPIRNFDELLIAQERLIGGALRGIVRRGDDEESLGRLVRDLAAALPGGSALSAITSKQVSIHPCQQYDQAPAYM